MKLGAQKASKKALKMFDTLNDMFQLLWSWKWHILGEQVHTMVIDVLALRQDINHYHIDRMEKVRPVVLIEGF